MIVNNKYFNNVNKISGNQTVPTIQKPVQAQGDFGSILQSEINKASDIKFSKHAEVRMQARNIRLSQTQKEKISQAVNKAAEKGIKDSLVLVDNLAFVVNVKNRTVITAVSSNELKENAFTNIDGAVFA